MIISFTLENWMSFRDPVTFSMVASGERQHGERVSRLKKTYGVRVLPIAAIYGGNASGKTNFFKALSFAKTFVLDVTQPDSPIPVVPFRLDAEMVKQPSRFSFELLIDEMIYEYSFAVTRDAVLEEKLVAIKTTSEKVLYHRQNGEPNFDDSLAKDQFLHFAFKGTRDNQLFLTNAISQKVDNFRPVYDWFKNTLHLVAPDSRFKNYEKFLDEADPLFTTMNEILPQLDTGIMHLGGEEIPFDDISLPEEFINKMWEDLKEGMALRLMFSPKNDRFVFTHQNGELIAKNLVSYHAMLDGGKVKFHIGDESDGSQRVIDLLPAFLELSAQRSQRVYVIDEVDRSLHTLLTRRLLESYLAKCSPESRTQLLFTTHDVLLMDQHLLRRDEMWVAERDSNQASSLIAFSDYKGIRNDKDLRKSYLQGRFGGIPRILMAGALTGPSPQDPEENA